MQPLDGDGRFDLLCGRVFAGFSIIAIVILCVLAIRAGIDGAALMTGYAAIGALGGGLAKIGIKRLLK